MKKIIASILALICCVTLVFAFNACQEEPQNNNDGIFYMEYKGTKIELGAKAEGIISALGNAKSIKELGDCGGLGAQIKYTYSDIELYTLKGSNGEETVDQIGFTSDLVSTSKKISLGDSKEKVLEAYGAAQEQSDSNIIYTQGQMTLKFKIKNQKVVSIDYIRTTK